MAVNSTINYDHPTNVSSAPDFFINYLDTQSNGAWSLVIIGLSFGIPFISLQAYGARRAFAAGTFNALVTTVLLASFGVVTGTVYSIVVIAAAVALVINNQGGDQF